MTRNDVRNYHSNESRFKRLIIQSQTGDSNAYYLLLTELSAFLKNYLKKRIYKNDDIDEVLQEILLATHRSLNTYDSQKKFMTWFLAISEYKIIDYIRSQTKISSESFDPMKIVYDYHINSKQVEVRLRIEKALQQMTQREREILISLKIKGYSVEELSRELNLSIPNTKMIAHRAYNNFIKFYGDNYEI